VDESLSADEMQTLQRIANGGGYIAVLREQDVARLLSLKFIYRDVAKVQLTELGRRLVFSPPGL
jgi:hypothetical protein